MESLKLGVAYHSNRLFSHVEEDLKEIVDRRFNLVVHMFSHNDWDRCPSVMKDIFQKTLDLGLDLWVDNWGLGGTPGDKSHFLCYHPEAHQYYSDGTMRPVSVCLNNEAYIAWTKEWVDKVYESGGRKIFWDEPYLGNKNGFFSCACPHCKKLFAERYGREMPLHPDADCYDFQEWSIVNYFTQVTEYSHSKGMENIVCVMLHGNIGISLDNIDAMGGIATMDNIGSDPYWISKKLTGADVYRYVYENTRKNLTVSASCGKEHNIWVQAYGNPAGREEDIVYATEAAYDAGARNILLWGFRGCDGNEYRAEKPLTSWRAACDAVERVLQKERDRVVAEARKGLEL